MRVAITGANGFVGQYLAKYFAQRDIAVRALVRRPLSSPIDILVVDFNDKNTLANALSQCDAVIHLAAKTHGKGANSWEDFLATNVLLSKKVAQAAMEAGVGRFIYYSSVKVLGEEATAENPFNNDSLPCPQDFYGRSKYMAEQALQEIFRDKPCTLFVIRPPLIWGEAPKGNLGKVLNLAKLGLPLPFANIHNQRHWISLENLADFTQHLLTMPVSEGAHIVPPMLVCDAQAKSTSQAITDLLTAEHLKPRLFSVPNHVWAIARKTPLLKATAAKLTGSLVVDASQTWKYTGWHPEPNTMQKTETSRAK